MITNFRRDHMPRFGVRPQNETQERVLAYCNGLRNRLGLPPRRGLFLGQQHNAHQCVVARTIGEDAYVDVNEICIHKHRFCITPPQVIQEFIRQFDDGLYPELFERKGKTK